MRKLSIVLAASGVLFGVSANAVVVNNTIPPANYPDVKKPAKKQFKSAKELKTQTPIKHVIVIFQENNSFDRYFGTYPNALNLPGEPKFIAKADTPSVNGLTKQLLTQNPNLIQPYRLTNDFQPCSQDHDHEPEILATNGGLMNKFVEDGSYKTDDYKNKCQGQVMGYYDGNTVTALWNYAQNYALNDNSFVTIFGPSTPGALNLVAGTNGKASSPNGEDDKIIQNGYIIEDPNPVYDDCSYGSSKSGSATTMVAKMNNIPNVGDMLSRDSVTWGWFQGGFTPSSIDNGVAICNQVTKNIYGVAKSDYNPHHQPFQYFAATANPHHLAPSATKMIGSTDQANHQYDMTDFWTAAEAGNLPAVSYLKAPNFQDGHGDYSNPRDEQEWLVNNVNRLQKLPEWKNTAIIIAWDDTDGDYDHVAPPKSQFGDVAGRTGYGTRVPLLVISPWAKSNYVDHTQTDQSSILKFIEYNWNLPMLGKDSNDQYAGSMLNMFDFKAKPNNKFLILDPKTGLVK